MWIVLHGAIHLRAVLGVDEVAAARGIGLPVLDRPDRPAFALPCPKLSGTACTIFGQRPRVCSRYQCQLLRDFQSGDVSLEAAEKKVAYAKALIAAITRVLPPTMSLPEARTLVDAEVKPSAPMAQRDLQELRLRVTALELYLDKNFRASRDGRALDMKELVPQ